MPIYEYICYECGTEFEKMVRFSEANQMPLCPKCAGQNTHKKISKVGSFSAASSGQASSGGGSCGSSGGFR